jgi:AraC-like DNA-binding protein
MDPGGWGAFASRAAGRAALLPPPALEALRQMLLLGTWPEPSRPHLARALLTVVLAEFGRAAPPPQAGPGPPAARLHPLIESRLSRRTRNADLARALGLGQRTLEARSRAETGEPVHRAIVRLRLEGAMRLLAEGFDPVKRVAVRAGFRDPADVIRAFMGEYGVTPGQVRRPGSPRPVSESSCSPA